MARDYVAVYGVPLHRDVPPGTLFETLVYAGSQGWGARLFNCRECVVHEWSKRSRKLLSVAEAMSGADALDLPGGNRESARGSRAVAFRQGRAAGAGSGREVDPAGEPGRGRPEQELPKVGVGAVGVFDVPDADVGVGAAGKPDEQRGGLDDLLAGVAAGRASALARSRGRTFQVAKRQARPGAVVERISARGRGEPEPAYMPV
jgi:hypothetical protein